MIQSVFKICTACAGTGEVEGPKVLPRNPNNPLDTGSSDPVPSILPCYVCFGEGYIPTGFFVRHTYNGGIHFSQELEGLHPSEKEAIIHKI